MSFLARKKNSLGQFDPWSSFNNEMNTLMEKFFGGDLPATTGPGSDFFKAWSPRVNLSETEQEYKVTAELPGLEEKDLEVTFHDNRLYIKGEKKFAKEDDKENYHVVESSYGTFQRILPFSSTVDSEKIAADFKNGVLTVKLGKAGEIVEKTRKIPVKSL